MLEKPVEKLAWVSHPVREGGRRLVIAFAVIGSAALLVGTATSSIFWALFAGAIIALGSYDYFLPTEFQLTRSGVNARAGLLHRHKPWKAFRSYHVDANGILLTPFARRHRMEAHRGLYVRFAGNRSEVVDYVAEHLKERA